MDKMPTEPDWKALWERSEKAKKKARRSSVISTIAFILAAGLFIGSLLFAISFRDLPATQDQIQESQEQVLCIAQLQSGFQSEVGNFANSAPAPSQEREQIAKRIQIYAQQLADLGEGKPCAVHQPLPKSNSDDS